MAYKRILLAYDGTREGAVALREGAILAKQAGAKLYILSVVPDVGGMQMAEGAYGGVVAYQMDRYREQLDWGVKRLTELGMAPTGRLVVGDPARAIGAFAREVEADLVVVGHRRKNLLERWWSGASGAYISDFIGCSLLIARNEIGEDEFFAEMKAVEVATQDA